MGKATRWLRSLLGFKKPSSSSSQSSPAAKDNMKSGSNTNWGQIKSSDNNERTPVGAACSSDGPSPSPYIESLDANKHAIAVAAATAAVAEAALAAAQAAAEVVRLTSAGGARTVSSGYTEGGGSREQRRRELAAIKIQSAFRAYLARRALRALRGLVKLQALVRGRIVRKQSADMLRRMQAMARIQARACASRVPTSELPHSRMKNSKFHHARGGSKSSINDNINTGKLHLDSSWLDRWMEESTWNNHIGTSFKRADLDDGKSDKILEIDTWKPRYNPRQSDNSFQASQYFSACKDNGQGTTVFDPISGLSTKFHKPNPSVSSEEVTSLRSLNCPQQEDQLLPPWAAEYSPRVHSSFSRPGSSSRRGTFTPTISECSRSLFGDYLGHPNYMANTESSRAKLRSQSAPRQRMRTEKLTGRKCVHGLWDVETSSEKGSTPHANFRRKAYPGSDSSDRLETPVQGSTIGYRMAFEARR